MRSAVVVAAFAAGALAVPYKRDMEVDYDVVYVTNVVTVTYGAPEQSPAAKAEHYGHHKWTSTSPASPEKVSTTSSASSSTSTSWVEQPISTTSTSSSIPVYVALTTTSTSVPVYVAPTTTSEAKAAAYTSSSSGAAPTSYKDIVVFSHNLHRTNHSAPDLAWSDDLASSAATIAASCVYAHNVDVAGGGYGQNIAAGVESNNVSAIITDLFYNGEEPYYAGNYGLADPDMTNFELWGHFSQIVWKSTTEVGCATQYCPNGLANTGSDVSPYFTVCNYKGPGNYAGEYGANVLAPLGHPSADWNTGL